MRRWLVLLLLVALTFIVQRTRVGTAMRAVSFNQQAAALMGVNINFIISFTNARGIIPHVLHRPIRRDQLIKENKVTI